MTPTATKDRPRVVISGAGSVNALGVGVDEFARALRAGRCAIRELSVFDTTSYRSSLAAEVGELAAPDWLPPAVGRHASRSDLFALMAAREAITSAGLVEAERTRFGVIVGASTGGMLEGEEYYHHMLGSERRVGLGVLNTPISTSADLIARTFACFGPRMTVSTACSSGNNALGLAADWIRTGRADVVVCGGVDSLCRMTFSGFNALQAVDQVPCRPFDRDRAGLSLGEGAAIFVLEAEPSARRRGIEPWAEFLGYGASTDAYHMTQPRPDGASALNAAVCAMEEGEVSADEIDYVNAHGTGTPLNDAVETKILKTLLGPRAYDIPVSSTKSMTGHCLAAAGAIEALASIIAMRDGFVPATVNLKNADPECDLDYVLGESRRQKVRTVLSNSYGFGGNNTTIVLRREG